MTKEDIARKKILPTDSNEFDSSVDVIGRPGFIWLAALSGVSVLSLIWAIFGSIKIEESSPSLFIYKNTVSFVRSEAQRAILKKYHVNIGQYVKKGDNLASLEVQDRIDQLKSAEDNLNFNKETIQTNIQTNNELLKVISERIQSAKELLDKKFITADVYNGILEKKLTLENQVKRAKTSLSQAQNEFNNAKRILDKESKIVSPFSGEIISLTSSVGQSVFAGGELVQIAKGKKGQQQKLRHIAFIPVTKGKKVKVGQPVVVTPSNTTRSEYGGIKGEIIYVSPFAVSPTRIMAVVDNESIAQTLASGPVLELEIRLNKDSNTKTGFEWTSGNGPNIEISSGLLSTTYIVTRIKRPISYALPFIKDTFLGKPIDEIKMRTSND